MMGGWQVLDVRCLRCGHEFVAVCPTGTPRDKIECGHCGAQHSHGRAITHQHPGMTERIDDRAYRHAPDCSYDWGGACDCR